MSATAPHPRWALWGIGHTDASVNDQISSGTINEDPTGGDVLTIARGGVVNEEASGGQLSRATRGGQVMEPRRGGEVEALVLTGAVE